MEDGNRETINSGSQGRFDQPLSYRPQYDNPKTEENKKHFGLALASLILSGLSLLCCCMCGLGIIPALIGAIFGLIALIKGKESVRVMGIVGLILGIIGVAVNAFMLFTIGMMIEWGNITPENLNSIQYVDPNSEEEMLDWMQQFFKIDIKSSYYQSY